ncbi:lysozyme [Bradyrhizobium elkanii]|uniref:lysozyme n=1 Tax=Bradyrhizobium elkanii TaxID=29448 RepID=UPI003519BA8E
MTMKRTIGSVAAGTGGAAVIAATVAFLPAWEGMDRVAKRDMIGTGHPITYCFGQTDEFGKVKAGTRFSKQECDEKLAQSLPTYLERLDKCVKRPVPVKAMSAVLDASYNAGTAAVCRSPMVAKFNAGDIRGGCNAFAGWYVRSDGKVRKGLIARRSGIGDGRKSERDLCLEGLSEPKGSWYAGLDVAPPKPAKKWWQK